MSQMDLHAYDDGARARDARPDPHWGGRLHNKGQGQATNGARVESEERCDRGKERQPVFKNEEDVTEAKKNTKRESMKEGQSERAKGSPAAWLPGCSGAAGAAAAWAGSQREREERAATSGMRRAQQGSHW